MLGIELTDAATAGLVLEAAREGGLLIGKGGRAGDALRIAPPLTLTVSEAEEGAEILEAALKQAAESQLPSS
jgi:4-aminobutyrate aminotransferase